ncbi:4'-phosphopantetheinyl transferase [Buchnera aphidicola (Diuraphis noxia)]|uniref:Holo-[acyl-carrier-protein] synthase n=1 Tax=Buchnera aphidicola subsp. Diuraphis noxia TaxID=118101 RepID=A0A1B2H8B5_BUCDN|nr:holo-ACP synthase [Buchnera aphidicola]ANZ22473.1 4'-phosphopantetheinyl transferase [Buchnera aphidicola (Diuraphis noxia)]
MSIVGIGIDIVDILRIKKIFLLYRHQFAKKILSKKEWKNYMVSKNQIVFLAKKFSAKEAASKALGTGINYGITFNQLELYHNDIGKPQFCFLKNALKRAKEIQCKSIHVSISDEKLYTYSVVVLES